MTFPSRIGQLLVRRRFPTPEVVSRPLRGTGPAGSALVFLVLALTAWLPAFGATTLSNQASGTSGGFALDDARARVSLARASSAVTSALAEIAPSQIFASSTGNAFAYSILPTIGPADAGVSRVEITVPAGHGNPSVTGVTVANAALASGCPTPGAGQYCATVGGGTITVVLGTKVTISGDRIEVAFTADAPADSGVADFPSTVADGTIVQATQAGDANGIATDSNGIQVETVRTQGIVLDLTKTADRRSAIVGEVVTYAVEIRNTTDPALHLDVTDVRVEDRIPPNFKYVKGTARLDGAALPDPAGNRPLVFLVGTVVAPVDRNSNHKVDADEPGYRLLTYQLVVGSGATPGAYTNTVVATDYCDSCVISNEASARVEVRLDPVMDLGTILGKVFDDRNRNGVQDPDEPGVPDAMVALDDGTYSLTDEFGRYHFPAVRPGHRMVKINLRRLPPGATATTDESLVLWITPGLMVTADFGVCVQTETERIEPKGIPVVGVQSEHSEPPIEVQGSAEALTLLVNGSRVFLPSGEVRLKSAELDGNVRVRGTKLELPARFELSTERPDEVRAFTLTISGPGGETVRKIAGEGAPPGTLVWDGVRDDGQLVSGGEVCAYQLELEYRDGSRATSARRLFGVDRDTVAAISLTGDAFESGKAVLGSRARKALDEAANVIRQYPGEKIVIEGHTDAVGSSEYNLGLSRSRAEAARDYLVGRQRLPEAQFLLAWYGEERPIAPNDFPEGRELNRRVVIEGEVGQTERVRVRDQYRTAPAIRINGAEIEAGSRGRFTTPIERADVSRVDVSITDPSGRSSRTAIAVPTLAITAPTGERLLPYGAADDGCRASAPPAGGWSNEDSVVVCSLRGRTEPGNAAEIDGKPLEVQEDGSFDAEIPLRLGNNATGVVVRNAQGIARIANLVSRVTDRDDEGRLLVASDGSASLTVELPPRGVRLSQPKLDIRGATDPESRVSINGQPVPVDGEGRFAASIELPRGPSRIVVEATNREGRTATIERDVEVDKHQIFLLAFAEGRFGKLKGKGFVEGAGLDESDQFFTDGRLAYYLKGVISGKYLITSAYSTDKGSSDPLFGNLGPEEAGRLLTNLDPDKYYPVYGDASTVVWDAESQGKFYLAVDSEEIHAVVGNYPLTLNQTELSSYQRTLYGGRFVYQSASRSRYGDPDTEVVVFGAEVRYAHVHDQVRATGGSVYYLSHRNVVEGSETVTLVVRDKNTGLQISNERQRAGVDYVVKYDEGRIMFQRPISSVVPGGSIVDQATLSGNSVYALVDYETILDGFEKTGYGTRVRKQLGDHVSVGGTYVKDQVGSGEYTLQGVDTEVKLGESTRIMLEAASSTGVDSLLYTSENGGLDYAPAPATDTRDGSAWKAALDLDVGEWFGRPGRYRARAYAKELEPGFFSNGSILEQGSRRFGLDASAALTSADTVHARYDRDERTGGGLDPSRTGETTTSAVDWTHSRERWGLAVELFDTGATGGVGPQDRTYMAARYWSKLGEKLTARFEHQQTLSGTANDQTSAGLEYRMLRNLAFEVLATDGTLGTSAQAGLVYTHGESSVYLTQRLAEDQAGQKTSTVLGARSPLGASSKVYAEYQWEDASGGGRTVSLLGLQRQWDFGSGLRFLLSGETSDVNGETGSGTRSAISGGVSYSNDRGLRAATRQEVRFESGTTQKRQYFTVNQIDYSVTPDVTLLGRLRYSRTEDRATGAVDAQFDERTVGAAYRPVRSQRLNALFKYTSLTDLRPLNLTSSVRSERKMDVFALDTSLRLGARTEWLAKEALRIQDDDSGSLPSIRSNTFLVIQRLNFKIWKPVGLGVEYRVLDQSLAEDRRQGWLTEVMWEFMKNFAAGVGYNFTDFSDDVFSQNDYQVQGWYFRVQARY